MAAPSNTVFNRSNPAESAVAVTPSDTTAFGTLCRALFVGGAGNVSLVMSDGSAIVFYGLNAGTILPVRGTRVNSTGTTATNIVALY